MGSLNHLCLVLFMLICSRSNNAAPVSIAPSDGLLPNGNFGEGPKPSDLKKATIIGKYSLPKWVKKGLVRYVSGGPKPSFHTFNVSRGVHAVSLGNEASIAQYLRVKKGSHYSLTFSTTKTCSLYVFLRVSTYNDFADFTFPAEGIYMSKEANTFAWGFQAISNTVKVTFFNPTGHPKYPACGPLVEAVAIKELQPSPKTIDNLVQNGDFEIGPHVLENFTTGVYIHPHDLNPISPLPGWIIGSRYTIRYLGSQDFFIPSGSSAVELLFGGKEDSIAQVIDTIPKKFYNLTFTIGDANNDCIGSMDVEASADKATIKVHYESKGKGGATHGNLSFQAVSDKTRITFWSVSYHTAIYNINHICGPVLDDIKVVLA